MKSPFKFLDAYTLEDSLSFFGRKQEALQLYQQLRNTSVTLLYGLSGTGKTSLVQCGLANFYDGPDWHPFLIRRGENINESIEEKLKSVLEINEDVYDLGDLVYEVFIRYSRPVYLIFDQFEEIFTLNQEKKTEEKTKFFKDISSLLKRNLPCKIIIIIREEFLGQLYEFEQFLPNLFDFKLRVEPMNTTKLNEVLTGTFKHFNVNADSEVVQSAIVKNLIDGNATSQLAYLQVYLDKLWKIAYKKQYGNQDWQENPPSVAITSDIITKVGDVNNVLNTYLEDQEQTIAEELGVNNEWIRDILDNFVTDDGTKRPITGESYLLNPKNRFSETQLSDCLVALQDARLIRKDKQFYELAHDALAGILDKKRTGEQRLIKNLTFTIKTSYELYTDKKGGGLLNEENVSLFDLYKVPIYAELKQDDRADLIIEYIEQSRKANEDERNSLIAKNKRLRILSIFVGIFGTIAVGVAIWAYNTSVKAEKSSLDANTNLKKYYVEKAKELFNDAKTYQKSGDLEDAYYKIDEAYKLDSNNTEIELLKESIKSRLEKPKMINKK